MPLPPCSLDDPPPPPLLACRLHPSMSNLLPLCLSVLFRPSPQVGSTFTLSWRVRMVADNRWVRRTSPPIESDAGAAELAEVLEASLGTGRLRVARTDPDPATGGRTWFVTFASPPPAPDADGGLPLLEADGSGLTGTGAAVSVAELNSPPAKVKGDAATCCH